LSLYTIIHYSNNTIAYNKITPRWSST